MTADALDPDLEALLAHLKQSRGFDFTGYKRASLARRIGKRMGEIGISSYAAYLDYLEVHPDEFVSLFNTILINVTAFFRDPEAWDSLRTTALPALLERKDPSSQIRVWSAGCASGEEAYSLAMVFADLLGPDAFRERVKIYATDADEEALSRARHAAYDERALARVPDELRTRFFDRVDDQFIFKKDFRRQVIFGRHDLIQDAPISRIDLLVCRNVLMYFHAETQAKILSRFYFALNDDSLLFLGRAETLLSDATNFAPLDMKRRISRKIPRARLSIREQLQLGSPDGAKQGEYREDFRLRDIALDTAPIAQIIIDVRGIVAVANERARQILDIAAEDVGRPLQDLRVSYRPVELRSLLDQVDVERRPLLVRAVEFAGPTTEARWFDLQLAPLVDGQGGLVGTSVSYIDVTTTMRLQTDLEQASAALESAYEELQSTNEELETTNEELQSTVEELETTNEELQSTNEELETMNEELHSTNEELGTINEELRVRSEELNHLNGFLQSILASLRGGVAVTDRELRVLLWNDRATDLWGLRSEEVIGKHLLGLDIGLPVDELKSVIKECLNDGRAPIETLLDAVNRRGRKIECLVTCSPLLGAAADVRGVILVMESVGSDGSDSARNGG